MKWIITMVFAALMGISGNFVHPSVASAQTVNNGACTSTSQCTSDPDAYCDGDLVSFGSGVCVDSDADGTLDICQWTGQRHPCGDAARCYDGPQSEAQCIAAGFRPRTSTPPAVCQGVTVPDATCSGNGGTLHFGTVGQSGACVLREETFVCQEGTECVASGTQSHCAPRGPRLIADLRPTSVGREGGLTAAEWQRVMASAATLAHAASDDSCDEVSGGGNMLKCSQLVECFNTTDADAATACWRQYLTIR